MRGLRTIALAALIVLFPTATSYAQAGRGGAPPTPKAASPTDFTGYWVSVVTEDWLYRMVTPAKGDYSSVPLNPEGRKVADAWDPTKDEAEGNQCKAYGAPGVTRVLEIMQAELVLAMRQTGCTSLSSINRKIVLTNFP